jgi:hypothetical protein
MPGPTGAQAALPTWRSPSPATRMRSRGGAACGLGVPPENLFDLSLGQPLGLRCARAHAHPEGFEPLDTLGGLGLPA